MNNSASNVESSKIHHDVQFHQHSKLRTYGFAILIIVGIGGLAVAGVGLGCFGSHRGWWQAGALSNLNQIHSITMMAAGGSGGTIFLIIGIVGSVKNNAKIGRGLNGLLTLKASPNQEIKSNEHQIALKFAHKMLEDHPEVKHTDFVGVVLQNEVSLVEMINLLRILKFLGFLIFSLNFGCQNLIEL